MKCINPKCPNQVPEDRVKHRSPYCSAKCQKKVQNMRYKMKFNEKVKSDVPAGSQANRISKIFYDSAHDLTAWQVHDLLPNLLITSIRRAMNDLVKRGILIPTGQVIERYGEKNTKYSLKCRPGIFKYQP